MALIYLDDLRLNAVIEGPASAPPLVLIHALGTDLTLWDAVLSHLPTLRVLRYDLRGHGQSDAPPAPYTMGALIHDCERLIDHFGLKDAVVVGLSVGGLVAQGLAVKRLDLVRGLILSNTATRIATPDIWAERVAFVRANGIAPILDPAMEQTFGRRWREAAGMPAIRALLETTDPDGWMGVASAVGGSDFYQTTASLTLPTLVLAGAEDAATPPDMQRELADLIRGADFQLIQRAGHLPPVDQPAAFAAALTGFLTRIGHV